MAGTLYVVATPIGNLDDLSVRALKTLRSVAWIACEDTRRARKLLTRHGIEARTISCHRFNEQERVEEVLPILRRGNSVALVSDGGTPGISDPGSILIRSAALEGIAVVPIPGPSAVAALLSASGIPADRFVFDGFLPSRAGERRRRLRELGRETRTVVVFEAPHRIRRTLEDMATILRDRPLVLGREMTKRHESIHRGDAACLREVLGPGEVKGEITIAFPGTTGTEPGVKDEAGLRIVRAWRVALRAADGDSRQALRLAARALGMKRPVLYRLLAEMQETGAAE